MRLKLANPDDKPFNVHGQYVSGVSRNVWAQNWWGDWVCQTMHNFSVPRGPDDDVKRARFVDAILKRRGK